MRPRRSAGCLWLLLLAGLACSEPAPSSAVKELRGAADPSSEQKAAESPLPRDAPPEQLLPLAKKRYAAELVQDREPIQGTLAQGARNDYLLVLKSGYCYRIVGVADQGVQDMDLLLYDPDGVQSNQDSGEDRYPVLGMQSELCPQRGGAYRLQVQMYQGGGAFAVGVYRTQ